MDQDSLDILTDAELDLVAGGATEVFSTTQVFALSQAANSVGSNATSVQVTLPPMPNLPDLQSLLKLPIFQNLPNLPEILHLCQII
jgi:hypothetical protein